MSKTIDERVVSMEFDNSRFEKNVATTMNTLENLKQKLNLEGAAKGFENINSAAKKVDLSGLSSAADTVVVKFSHMQMTIQHQIDRIVDYAISAGSRLAKSLSVDQISSGMSKYEQKTAAIQTLVNATGKGFSEINGYLGKLMWFSDETSYSFTEMLSGLSTMVSSGGDIEKLIPMITGIANATAYAGKGAAEFTRALRYGVNQAYSLGYMQSRDWMSIEGATINSKQLIETLIEAGEAVGTLKKGQVTINNFRESLADKWLNKEVMEVGFGKFSKLSDAAYKLLNGDIGDFPKEVQELFNAGKINTTADAIDVLSKYYDKLSVRAFKSAQEAKTFTEAIEATKDAVSTGWMNTFEIIFGDYEKARELWTNLANALWTVFASGAEQRNFILGGALNLVKPWEEIEKKLGNVTKVVTKFRDATSILERFQTVVSDVWRGDYGNGQPRFDLLEKAGYDSRVVQDLVNKGLNYKITVEDIEESHRKFNLTLDTSQEETEQLTVALDDLSEEKLRDVDLTEEEIDLYKALSKEAKKQNKTVSELAKEMSENDGRTLLFAGIGNIGKTLLDVSKIVKDAFADIFNPPSAGELIVKIYNLVKSFKEFTDSLRLVNTETGELTETGDKISRIFKGMFAAVSTVVNLLKGPAKIGLNTIRKVLNAFGVTSLDVLANIGDGFVKIDEHVTKSLDSITTFISETLVKWIENFKNSEFVTTVTSLFKGASEKIGTAVNYISIKLSNFKASHFMQTLSSIWDFFQNIGKRIINSDLGSVFVDGMSTAFASIKDFFSKIPKFTMADFANIAGSLEDSGITSLPGALAKLAESTSATVVTKLKQFFKNITSISWDDFKNKAFKKFLEFWATTSRLVKGAFEACKGFARSIREFIFGAETFTLKDILDLVEKLLGIVVLIKALNLLSGAVEPFDNITSAFNNIGKALNNLASYFKWNAISSTFKSMALALAALTLCIIVITKIDDMNKAKSAATMLGSLIVVMGAVALAMGWASTKLGSDWSTTGVALSLLAMVGSLVLLVKVIKNLDGMDLKDPEETFVMLTGALLAMVIGMAAISKAGGSSFKSIAAVLTMVTALKMLLDVIEAYDQFDWTGRSVAIRKMCEMLFALSASLSIASIGRGGSSGAALTILAMVFSLKLILKAIEEFAGVDDATMEKGGQAVVKLLGVMTLMAVAISLSNQGTVLEKGQRSANSFTGLATALLAVVASVWLLGKMATSNEQMFEKGMSAVITILLTFTGILGALALLAHGAIRLSLGTLATMVLGIGGLVTLIGFVIQQMSTKLDPNNAISSAKALGGVLLAMAVLIAAIGKLKVSKSWSSIGKLSVMLAGLVVIVALLGLVFAEMSALNVSNATSNAIGLSTLLITMSGVLHILSSLDMRKLSDKKMGKLASMFGGMSAILAVLGLVLAEMSALNVTNAIENATALSILIGTLSLCTIVLAGASAISSKIGPGIMALVALAAVLGLLVLGLSDIKNVDIARENAKTLANLAIVLSLCTIPLAIASVMAPVATVGAVLLVALAAVLGLLVWGLSAIKDTETARANVETIILLMGSLTSMILSIGSLGVNSLVAVAAIGVLIYLVRKIGQLAEEIGLQNVDETSITNGLNIIKLIAKGLGEVISAFGEGLTSSLPAIAENLSSFADKLGTFVSVMGDVDEDIIDKTKNLAAAIIELTKGNLLNTLASFGDGTLGTAGEDLSNFAGNAADFISAMENMSTESVEKMSMFANAINTLNTVCGDNNLTNGSINNFGEGLSGFAESIKSASIYLDGITDTDVENIKRSAKAGEALADLSKVIPGSGGIWQKIAGEKDLASWGVKISAFADSLIAYSNKVSGGIIDKDSIVESAEAGTSISDLNNSIPKDDGEWQKFAGSNDIAVWGSKIVAFAESLIAYSNTVTGNSFDKQAILDSAEAASALAKVNDALPKSDGTWQSFFGDKDMANFGNGLEQFANGLVTYGKAALEITQDKIDAIKNTGNAVDEIKLVIKKLPKTGGTADWFGTRDPGAFGTGIQALADGVKHYIDISESITDIEKLSLIGDCITKINEVVALIDQEYANDTISYKVECFASMVMNLKNACDTMKYVSGITYDSGKLDKLKIEINSISTIFDDVDVNKLLSDWTSISDIVTKISGTSSFLASINTTTYGGIDTLKRALNSLAESNVDGVIKTFSGKAESMTAAVGSIVSTLASGLSDGSTKISTEAENLANTAIIAIENKKDQFKTIATDFVSNLLAGFTENINSVINTGSAIGGASVSGVNNNYSGMKSAGENLGDGLIVGINSKQTSVYWSGYALGQAAVIGEKNGQESNSPSKATIKSGKWLGEGLIIGMQRIGTYVYNAGKDMGKNAVGSIANSIRAISNTIDTDMDIQPTIRPVIDLTDVRTGANAINGMFGGISGIGVHSNLNAINFAMNSKLQNGNNNDVISAINKLNDGLAKNRGNSYSIGGISVSEGTDAADAIHTLVRAIKMEGRT